MKILLMILGAAGAITTYRYWGESTPLVIVSLLITMFQVICLKGILKGEDVTAQYTINFVSSLAILFLLAGSIFV
ncbi:hypothetical protein [Salirhabdus salicampi]|uniref:hypothetical protein n=1 Tax=Salirhabdus salicampi TaxID=476102 RepID=UPI0020C49480|nr:hypothetical protein [Salirhabdus salicampi]MCP8617039.1 hypothetical protein [Salirhabdus salicampi]